MFDPAAFIKQNIWWYGTSLIISIFHLQGLLRKPVGDTNEI